MTSKLINNDSVLERKWYTIGMVWLVITLPTIVVIASLITAVIAHRHAPILNHSTNSAVEASR